MDRADFRRDALPVHGPVRAAADDSPAPLFVVSGEIDESTDRDLIRGLRAAMSGYPEVHLDLAQVTFCDIAGLRGLVSLADPGTSGSAGGRRLVLHNLPATLRTLMAILGWDQAPEISIDPPAGP
jgi:ABC-type transporter Mla MlaB component